MQQLIKMRCLSGTRSTRQAVSCQAFKTENSTSNEVRLGPIPAIGQIGVGFVLSASMLFSGATPAMADVLSNDYARNKLQKPVAVVRLIQGFALPALPYADNALQPYIDEQTMNIHHTKHHQAYITNLNAALEKAPALKKMTLADLNQAVGTSKIPSDVSGAIRNHGGGHWNHSFFWKIMSPSSGPPSGELAEAINAKFGSVDAFKEQFSGAAKGVFGSGWAWLVVTPNGDLAITTTPNQDNPLMAVASQKGTPVIGIDVWEHAYYLKHQNKRPGYVADWLNVINWDQAASNYADAKAGKVPA